MTEGQLKRNIEKALLRCLEEAAIDTAALAIVTGGLGLAAAAEAFVTAFMDCIEKQVSDAIVCIIGSLHLVTERGDWEEKVF